MENEQIVEFNLAVAEIADETNESFVHPLLTNVKFVFANNKGAPLSTRKPGLLQGIKSEDFEEVIKTAVDTPIKMKFERRSGTKGHFGSIPIGHIKSMAKEEIDGIDSLVGWGVLYTSEFPDEVNYIKTAYAEKRAPGISYEIMHTGSIIENGVEWLKGMVTRAATFVRSPAYGNKTAILALASDNEITPEDFSKELLAILQPDNKGGSDMEEKDKKIEELTAKLAAAEEKASEVETLKASVAELTTQISTLTTENTTLKRAAIIEERSKAFTDAGLTFEADAEKATKKKSFLADMPEDVFTEYLADLKVLSEKAKEANTALASRSDRGPKVPRLAVAAGEGSMSLDDIKNTLRANRSR